MSIVVIVCVKKTDSGGGMCGGAIVIFVYGPVLSEHAPVAETIPGYQDTGIP